MDYKQIAGSTTEQLIESIDACLDVLIRKPRKTVEVTINQTPGGCQLKNVNIGEMLGVGFYVTQGNLKNFMVITPANIKNLSMDILRSKGSETNITEMTLTGTSLCATDIDIPAGTEVYLKLNHASEVSIAFLTVGFVFEPKGV